MRATSGPTQLHSYSIIVVPVDTEACRSVELQVLAVAAIITSGGRATKPSQSVTPLRASAALIQSTSLPARSVVLRPASTPAVRGTAIPHKPLPSRPRLNCWIAYQRSWCESTVAKPGEPCCSPWVIAHAACCRSTRVQPAKHQGKQPQLHSAPVQMLHRSVGEPIRLIAPGRQAKGQAWLV